MYYFRLTQWARQSSPAVTLTLLLLLLIILVTLTGAQSIKLSVTEALVEMVVVIGLFIFIGPSGVISFGHIAFMAIGAYATTWLTCCLATKGIVMYGLPGFLTHYQMPNFPAVVVSGLLAAAFGLVTGVALMRLSGLNASIAMFCILMIVYVGYSNWDSVTLGRSSIYGLPSYVNLWIAFGWVVAAIGAARSFQVSRYGLALAATREDEVAAKACGISIYWMRLIAFVLSAFFVGVGGSLYAFFLGGVSTNLFYLDMTFLTLAMLVVGGMNTLSGAVVGVVVVSTVGDLLRRLEDGVSVGGMTVQLPVGSQGMALAAILLLILIYRPKGITGGRELYLPWPVLKRRTQ